MKTTIVIPNYNGKEFLGPCLESLKKQTEKHFSVIVVDNGSTDGSVEYLRKNFPSVKIIVNSENLGFSAAVNRGIRHSVTPYVLLLNNDTIADDTFVEEMENAIEKDRSIFAVSSKMVQMYHPELLDSAGDSYTVVGWAVCRGTGRSVGNYENDDNIFSACAGAAIYRRLAFERIGYFDESHFAYLEDIDICYRAKIYGYRNRYCSTAVVYHVGSGTSGSKYNEFKVRLSARNSVWLNYKNMPNIQLGINLLPLIMGYILKTAFFYKIGFGETYLDGVKEGIRTRRQCKRVRFRFRHLPFYFGIECELIANTFRYTQDWISRKVLHR